MPVELNVELSKEVAYNSIKNPENIFFFKIYFTFVSLNVAVT